MSKRQLPKALQEARENRAKTAPKACRSSVDSISAEGTLPQVRLSGVVDAWYETADKITAEDSALREMGVTEADLIINSPGGDHIEALAIFDLIQESPIAYNIKVIGNACSAAATIAMAAPKERRFIGANARFMIHEAQTFAYGRANDLRETALFVDGCNADMRGIYAKASGKSEETIAAEMDTETWYQGEAAVTGGFFASTIDLTARAELDAEVLEGFKAVPHEVISELGEQISAEATVEETTTPVIETPAVQEPVAPAAQETTPAPLSQPEVPPAPAPVATQEQKIRAQVANDPAVQALDQSAETDGPVVVSVAPAPEKPAARPQSVRERQLAMFHPQPRR